MAVTQGIKSSYDITAAATSAGVGQAPDRRRLYDFSDRVAELAPEESPFFVYLSKVAKVPTDDPVFRFLENRSKIDWSSRDFLLASTPGTVVAGSSYSFTVDADSATGGSSSGGSAPGFLIKGMVFSVATLGKNAAAGYSQALVRVESSPVVGSSSTTFTGKVVDFSALTNSGGAIAGEDILTDNDLCQVIGTSFQEGSEMPELERWVLNRIWCMDSQLRKACDDFAFHALFSELHNFCGLDLSAFYFDIRKDSLYCDRLDDPRRRAARTVLDILFDCLTAWLAPFICFTAEEAWLTRHPDRSAGNSVHLRTFPVIPDTWRDDELAAKWHHLRAVRRVVTGALEKERAEKRIGSSLQAAPVIHTPVQTKHQIKEWRHLNNAWRIHYEIDDPPFG